jgi:hypothetical protein
VRKWPPITEPELLERLALSDEQFATLTHTLAAAWGKREFQPALFERALGYPWARPAGSYLLRDDGFELLDDLDPAERESTVRSFTTGRYPLLSFGGNAAPEWLAAKFAHFPDEANRTVLVLTGDLHGVDVGAAATPSILGYMPATLFASPGTAVRAAVLWTTAAQVTQLTWSELGYRLGRLDDAHFVMDEADVQVDDIFAYIHRLGAFCIDGAPVALAAIPAANRTVPALTQEELLETVAQLVIAPDARAEDLVRAIFEDMAGVIARASETVWPSSQQLLSPWTPLPATVSHKRGS